MIDVSVLDTQALVNRYDTIQKVLQRVHLYKRAKYDYSCKMQGVTFHPIILTHLGVLLHSSSVTLSILLGISKPVPGVEPSFDQRSRQILKSDLLNSIACVTAKYLARSIISHAPGTARPQNNP